MATTVFLTGGTGYLGGTLLRQLLDAGYAVRALVRRAPAPLPAGEVEPVVGDLSDPDRLAGPMRGCAAVFHSAALVSCWARDRQDFYQTNVDGLRNVLRAAAAAGTGTVVYTSSFFALGPAELPGAREDSGAEPTSGYGLQPGRSLRWLGGVCGTPPYLHSKFLARAEARQAKASGFPIVILYPGVIYGPGRRTAGNLVGRLVADFVSGRMSALLGNGRQIWSFAFIEDVARGHLRAMERAAGGGEFVLGGDNVSLRGFYEILARLSGRPAPRLRLPAVLGALAGALEFARARALGSIPAATPATVLAMYKSWACDSGRAQAELGYDCTPLEQGLRLTLDAMDVPTGEGRQ